MLRKNPIVCAIVHQKVLFFFVKSVSDQIFVKVVNVLEYFQNKTKMLLNGFPKAECNVILGVIFT